MRPSRDVSFRLLVALLAVALAPAHAQTQAPLLIEQKAMANHPFTVVSEGGALLGAQDGTFELWQDPVKLLRDFRITAHLQSYDATLQMNSMAATIEVRPEETVITLAHAAITIREHLLVDHTGRLGRSPAVAYFEIHATRPGDIVFSFLPVMQRQWPAPNNGIPSASWRRVANGSGYVLATDDPGFFGVTCIPGTTPGPMPPYQERTRLQPTELHLHFDPKTDDGRIYPLLTAVSDISTPATQGAQDALLSTVLSREVEVSRLARANATYYDEFFARALALVTPDTDFNQAFRWAEVSIDQSRIRSPEGVGLAAGWSSSDDTARPGFGWFFGRDTLWSLYAVNSYGDFQLTRQALDFLLLHQRADGKMMHEYSQTAAMVDWAKLPYLYAAADSTPLFLMQMRDYVRSSGNTAYLTQHWKSVRLAYQFIQAHRENGLYSNAEGTGWVEEWPGPRPHQEIYLAALDVQACQAMAALARLMKDGALASEAETAAAKGEEELATYRRPDGWYAFSRNEDNSFDTTQSIFPAVAWWDRSSGLPGADAMLDGWAGSDFSVDWGIRSVSSSASIYDPISYHHGSVWPLYAGWAAVAEFRSGRTLQANELVRQTLALDRLQDLGATTEVISGEFLEPLSRSSSHQLWSSAMAIEAVTRGMLGLAPDALRHTLEIDPHIPASWDQVQVNHVSIGAERFDIQMMRAGETLRVEVRSKSPSVLCLTRDTPMAACAAAPATLHTLSVPLPPVEVDFPVTLPWEGDRSSAMHVVDQSSGAHSLTLELEALAGCSKTLILRKNLASASVGVEGGDLAGNKVTVHFPAGSGYVHQQVRLHW
jgi:glycogen debranching enzyme